MAAVSRFEGEMDMFRFSKSLALAMALLVGLVGLGVTLQGSTSGSPAGSCNVHGVPCLQAVLDEATETLVVTGQGAPLTPYSFRLYHSIQGATWVYLGPIPGYFDANGEMSFSIPLSIFGGLNSVTAVMDLSVWDNTGPTSQFLTSMPWAMTMQEADLSKFSTPAGQIWSEWEMPLPGTVSPTFTMSMGVLPPSGVSLSHAASADVFIAGPAVLLQALYSTGIEGMLPVN